MINVTDNLSCVHILKFELQSDKPITVPKSYNHLLQHFFYSKLEKELHDQEGFKFFVYSKIISNKQPEKRDGILTYDSSFKLYFASVKQEILNRLVNSIITGEDLKLGPNKLYSAGVSQIEIPLKEKMILKALSPIVIYKTQNGVKMYSNPWCKEFYDGVKHNLLHKYEVFYGRQYDGELDIQPHYVHRNYRRKLFYKGLVVEGWEGYYEIAAREDMMRIVLGAGLGVMNSAGFGMMMVDEKGGKDV